MTVPALIASIISRSGSSAFIYVATADSMLAMGNGSVTAVRKTYLSRILRDTQRNTAVETAVATLRSAHLVAVALIADESPLFNPMPDGSSKPAHYAVRNDWCHDIWLGHARLHTTSVRVVSMLYDKDGRSAGLHS